MLADRLHEALFWNSVTVWLLQRIGQAQGKDKKWGPAIWIVWGGLGARPQEMLICYMLWSVFWGVLWLFFVHVHRTYLQIAVFD